MIKCAQTLYDPQNKYSLFISLNKTSLRNSVRSDSGMDSGMTASCPAPPSKQPQALFLHKMVQKLDRALKFTNKTGDKRRMRFLPLHDRSSR